MKSKIERCTCEHDAQDAMHGKHMRVKNQTKQGLKPEDRKWRCTVCGTPKRVN